MIAQWNNFGIKPIGRDSLPRKAEQRDTYKVKRTLPEPTLCPGCGAVFTEGQWQWRELSNAHESLCPACHRQQDNSPAGFITISGDFVATHETEILEIVHHEEQREKVEHPLKRVMNIEKLSGGFLVTTTDSHLARGIGEALYQAYRGQLDFDSGPKDNLLLVHWHC